MTNDFTVSEYNRASYLPSGETVKHVGTRWAVRGGGGELIAVKHSKPDAEVLAGNLNRDPWFLDRGYTKADRAAGF